MRPTRSPLVLLLALGLLAFSGRPAAAQVAVADSAAYREAVRALQVWTNGPTLSEEDVLATAAGLRTMRERHPVLRELRLDPAQPVLALVLTRDAARTFAAANPALPADSVVARTGIAALDTLLAESGARGVRVRAAETGWQGAAFELVPLFPPLVNVDALRHPYMGLSEVFLARVEPRADPRLIIAAVLDGDEVGLTFQRGWGSCERYCPRERLYFAIYNRKTGALSDIEEDGDPWPE